MMRETENQATDRVLGNCFYQRSKVKVLANQQCSLPHLTPFHQETPMKPSQVPNRLSYAPPKRILPLSSPELVCKSKPNPHLLGPVMSKPASARISSDPAQCQQLTRTIPSEKSNPAVNSNCSSHKRRREKESGNEMNRKKRRFRGPNSGETQATHPTADNPPGRPLVSQPPNHSSSKGQLPKARDGSLHRESSKESTSSEPSVTLNPKPIDNSSLPAKLYTGLPVPMGAKQVMLHSTQNDKVTLISLSSSSPEEVSGKKRGEAINDNNKLDTFTDKVPQKDRRSSLLTKLSCHLSRIRRGPTCVLEEKRKSESITLKSNSHFTKNTSEPRKAPGTGGPIVSPNDENELFTPDPIVKPPHKTAKTTTKESTHRSHTSEKDCSTHTTVTPCTPITEYLCTKTKSSSIKKGNSHLLPHPFITKQASSCPQSLPQEGWTGENGRKPMNEEDSMDFDLDLTVALDCNSSSQSSGDDDELPPLQKLISSSKPPDTPVRSPLSEPSTPGPTSPLSIKLNTANEKSNYKNTLPQMLKEIDKDKRAKEEERKIQSACKEVQIEVSEYEAAEQNQVEALLTKDQEFLNRFTLMLSKIKDEPPGEEVFNLEKFGQIFNQDSLQLRQFDVRSCGTAQKTLLRSIPAQLKQHLTIGSFQETYGHQLPCPTQVSEFLFKMMSVHGEMMVSDRILQVLCDIACSAAYQRMNFGNQQFKVWVPRLADVTLILMNMGAAFVKLYPLENLQPPFSESDLLEDHYVRTESPSNEDQTTFFQHNCNNMLKYVSYCMGLCPHAFSDQDLLLLLTMVGRISLDPQLISRSTINLYPLQYQVVNHFKDWDSMLPRICQTLTDVTDDHHNMCQLVHLLPYNKRGKQLRQHLSLCMISKLLDGNCTYSLVQKDLQLSELKPFIPRMRPSALKVVVNSLSSRDEEDTLDQQAYYLCYSLLTLVNEVATFPFCSRQKEQLLRLLRELDAHVKSDIRESGSCFYRSQVKDLQARICTKWEMLLKKTRPLNGQLHDWLPVGTLMSSQEVQERSPTSERLQ